MIKKIFYDMILGDIDSDIVIDNQIDSVEYEQEIPDIKTDEIIIQFDAFDESGSQLQHGELEYDETTNKYY